MRMPKRILFLLISNVALLILINFIKVNYYSENNREVAEFRTSTLKTEQQSIKNFLTKSWNTLGLNDVENNDLPKLRSIYSQFLPTPIPSSCQSHNLKPSGDLTLSGILAKQEIKRLKKKKFLPKTVFEGATKVVLFVGLEGTGHHFVMRSFRVLFNDQKYGAPFGGYTSVIGCKTHSVVFSNNQTVERFKKSLRNFKSHVAFLNTLTGSTMQSYPNCNGIDRVLKEPDARQLAEICEELGLDFQIILLNRSPESMLVSTTLHTHYGPNLGHQTVTYNYIIQILLAQLESLDKRFLTGCIDIELDKAEAILLVSPLKSRLDLDDKKIEELFEGSYTQKKPVCINPLETATNWDFTPDLSEYYRHSILLTHLCKSIPTFHEQT